MNEDIKTRVADFINNSPAPLPPLTIIEICEKLKLDDSTITRMAVGSAMRSLGYTYISKYSHDLKRTIGTFVKNEGHIPRRRKIIRKDHRGTIIVKSKNEINKIIYDELKQKGWLRVSKLSKLIGLNAKRTSNTLRKMGLVALQRIVDDGAGMKKLLVWIAPFNKNGKRIKGKRIPSSNASFKQKPVTKKTDESDGNKNKKTEHRHRPIFLNNTNANLIFAMPDIPHTGLIEEREKRGNYVLFPSNSLICNRNAFANLSATLWNNNIHVYLHADQMFSDDNIINPFDKNKKISGIILPHSVNRIVPLGSGHLSTAWLRRLLTDRGWVVMSESFLK